MLMLRTLGVLLRIVCIVCIIVLAAVVLVIATAALAGVIAYAGNRVGSAMHSLQST